MFYLIVALTCSACYVVYTLMLDLFQILQPSLSTSFQSAPAQASGIFSFNNFGQTQPGKCQRCCADFSFFDCF